MVVVLSCGKNNASTRTCTLQTMMEYDWVQPFPNIDCWHKPIRAFRVTRIFPHQKKKMPNKWRTIKSWVHKIQLHGWRGKGTAESFSREKIKASTAEGRWMRNPVWPSSCVTPAGTSTSLTSRINGKKTQHNTQTPLSTLPVFPRALWMLGIPAAMYTEASTHFFSLRFTNVRFFSRPRCIPKPLLLFYPKSNILQ